MDCYFPLSLRWLPLSQLAWPQAHNTIAHAQPPILIVCYFLFFLPSLSLSIGCSLPLLSQAIVALEPQTHLPLSHYSSSLTLFLLSHGKKLRARFLCSTRETLVDSRHMLISISMPQSQLPASILPLFDNRLFLFYELATNRLFRS